jgi:hypothetical protein
MIPGAVAIRKQIEYQLRVVVLSDECIIFQIRSEE